MYYQLKNTLLYTGILLWLSLTAFSCTYKHATEISSTSQQLCDCFNKQKSNNIDTKLTPCIDTIMHSLGYSSSSFSTPISTDSLLIKTKLDSINRRNYTFVTTLINEAVMSCDKLGAETEAMYDNWYPVDSSATNIKAIRLITSELNKIPTTDSTYKNTLHILISRNIKARRLELALQDCKRMKNLYPNEGGAYFASAFIYNLQNKYPLAIIEIKKEMIIENKPDLNLIIAIIKRKAKSNDVKIK